MAPLPVPDLLEGVLPRIAHGEGAGQAGGGAGEGLPVDIDLEEVEHDAADDAFFHILAVQVPGVVGPPAVIAHLLLHDHEMLHEDGITAIAEHGKEALLRRLVLQHHINDFDKQGGIGLSAFLMEIA